MSRRDLPAESRAEELRRTGNTSDVSSLPTFSHFLPQTNVSIHQTSGTLYNGFRCNQLLDIDYVGENQHLVMLVKVIIIIIFFNFEHFVNIFIIHISDGLKPLCQKPSSVLSWLHGGWFMALTWNTPMTFNGWPN